MRVSIITVVRDRANTIERAILSVLGQDYSNIEYILIDGQSTDGTLEIIKKYKNKVSKIVSEKDYGIYDAINKGLTIATGDIIGLLHSDDVYMDNVVISNVVSEFINNNLDVVYADAIYVSKNHPEKIMRYYSSKFFTPKKLSWGLIPAHTTIFHKLSILDKIGLYDPQFKIAGDFDFLCRLFSHKNLRYSYLEKILVSMQLGGASNQSVKANMIASKEIIVACKKNGLRVSYLKIYTRYFFKIKDFTRAFRLR
jgi:glycosyltransferase involved in cell wall biosynthesis